MGNRKKITKNTNDRKSVKFGGNRGYTRETTENTVIWLKSAENSEEGRKSLRMLKISENLQACHFGYAVFE